jgi:hypothetical protein
MRTDRKKYFVLMTLTCAFLMAAMCATGLAQEKKTGKDAPSIHGKHVPKGEKPGHGKGPSHDKHRERMTQWEKERNNEYIAWLKTNYPEEAARLEEVQKNNPKTFNRFVRMSRKKYGEIMETQKENPRLAEILKQTLETENTKRSLIKKIRSLAKEIKGAKGPRREKLMQQLKDTFSVRFDLIVTTQKLRYEALEEKIRQLSKQIARQKAETEKFIQKKDEEIAKRMKNLLAEDKAD